MRQAYLDRYLQSDFITSNEEAYMIVEPSTDQTIGIFFSSLDNATGAENVDKQVP